MVVILVLNVELINDKNWLLKFPQETSTFDNVTISFTTSPLSEYVGSHIYQLLGYTVHNTMLGYYFNKELGKKQIVVACEDFTENDKYTLVDYEFRFVKYVKIFV